jgi:RNA polymerase sigma-70 factor (ECF subfamily)
MAPAATNTELVACSLSGDPRSFEELVRRHLRAVTAIALAVVGEMAEAEDIAQETFVVALQQLSSCREPEAFAGWILQIARNLARNQLRTRRSQKTLVERSSPLPALPGEAERLPLRASLAASLARLSELQREVVLLHDLQGFSHLEIGALLGLSEVNARQHLFVARRKLRACLAEEEAQESHHGRE